MANRTTKPLYVALMRRSNANRADIIYAGFSKFEAENALYAVYDEYYIRYSDEAKETKYNKSEFLTKAENSNDSMLLQLCHYHINFELHVMPHTF